VAHAIESLFKDHAEERASLLAYHLEQAGRILKQPNRICALRFGRRKRSKPGIEKRKKVRELLLDQPPSQPINYLKMAACGQIVNFGWREGMSAEDARVYFEEAKQLAVVWGI